MTRPRRTTVSKCNVWALAAVSLLGISGCMPEPPPPDTSVTLLSVVDGDTIETSEGTVRLIGVDTPERGECDYDDAAGEILAVIAPGDSILLEHPAGQDDTDRYDRLLRYVSTASGDDIGLLQLEAGHAVARYDSLDGYPKHPRESQYHSAQIATLDADRNVVTAACGSVTPPATDAELGNLPHQTEAIETTPPATPLPEATPEPAPAPTTASPEQTDPTTPWYMNYSSCSKLKRNTVGDPTGPFNRDDPAQADIYNWFQFGTGHRGDGDGDGFACE